MKKNITTIELPIYRADIVVIIDNWEEADKKFKLDLEKEDLKAHAITWLDPVYKKKHEIFVLLKTEFLDYNTVCHELYHIVMFVCEAKGIKPDLENDEPLAYLLGHIAEKLFAFRDKWIRENENRII